MVDKAALVAAQSLLTGMGLTQRVGESDLIAFYQAWATEQVSIQLGNIATNVGKLADTMNSAIAENVQSNGLIQQALDETAKIIATIPALPGSPAASSQPAAAPPAGASTATSTA
jgi:hypothetical protein